jgi:peptidoglycan/xylan/chitin deacetylase (PgdA/CDA1 family)
MTDARRRRLTNWAATGIVVLLVAAGCSNPTPSSQPSAAASPAHSLVVPTIAPSTPTPSPSPSLEITTPPKTPPPLAGSFPIVNSCDPASVPGAIPVAAPASPKAGAFTLYVPVLMYHRIVPFAESGKSIVGLVVPPQTFDAQLSALAGAGWHTITMATLADDLQAHVRPPAKTLVITLDDGWYDGFTYALPILQKHDFVATFYVIAGEIDQPPFLSSSQLQGLVAAGNEIGDHTMDHANLTALRAADLKYQIDAGAARIAQVTGVWPESLAYPSGYEDGRVAAAVGACQELRIAVLAKALYITTPAAAPKAGETAGPPTTIKLQGYETWADRFVVPRIRVTPGTTPAVLLGLLGQT